MRSWCSLWLVGVTALSVTGCGFRFSTPPDLHPKRVLVLSIDTLRWDALSANGYDLPSSPAMDQLIAESVSFDRAFAPVPRTTPSLATLLTGRYPHGHGIRTLFERLSDDVPTLPALAKAKGYRTAAFVSNHLLTTERGLDRGFDTYSPGDDGRDAQATVREAIEWMRGLWEDDNALMWVHLIDPHVPYVPKPQHAKAFDPDYEGPYAERFGGDPGSVGDGAYPAELGKRGAVFQNTLGDETNAHIRRLYAADVRSTDDAVAVLLERFKEAAGDDWVIVLTADHGEDLGEHDFYYDHGDYVWQGGIHIPFTLAAGPAVATWTPRRILSPASLADLTPTLVDALGLSWPEGTLDKVEGRSLVPALEGEVMPPRPAFAESGHSFFFDQVKGRTSNDLAGRFRAAVDGSSKLIWTPGLPDDQAYALYDLGTDTAEKNNLATAQPEELERMKKLLHSWVRDETQEYTPPSDADRAALEALGYMEADEPEAPAPTHTEGGAH